MTLKELQYDIVEVLTRFHFTDDSRLDLDIIHGMIMKHRAEAIQTEFFRTGVINPAWVSTMGLVLFTEVTVADDPAIDFCECSISKAVLPATINISSPNSPVAQTGIYMLLSACGTKRYYPYRYDLMLNLPKESTRNLFNYYAKLGATDYFVNRKTEYLIPHLILENPLEGYIYDTTAVVSGNLVVGTNYTVVSGQAVHNSIGYGAGTNFTAVNTTFTGTAIVRKTTVKRQVTDNDPYPITAEMAKYICWEIWTKEFGIEKSQITDVKNDGKDDQQKINQP